MKKINSLELNTFLWLVLGMIFLINIGVIFQTKSVVAQKSKIAEEINRPANIAFTIINDSSCADCASLDPYLNDIKAQQTIKVTKEEIIDAKSEEGKKLIKDLDIKKIPTFIAKGELSKFDSLLSTWNTIGKIDNDTFIFTKPAFKFPIIPYIDIASGQIKGRVNLTMISDKSCKECQDATIYKNILIRFGMIGFAQEKNLDKEDAEGKDLIKKYNIGAIPTIILTGEVSEYEALAKTWSQAGTIEKDGAYVFRELKATGLTYSDLKTGKIINPATPTPVPAPKPN